MPDVQPFGVRRQAHLRAEIFDPAQIPHHHRAQRDARLVLQLRIASPTRQDCIRDDAGVRLDHQPRCGPRSPAVDWVARGLQLAFDQGPLRRNDREQVLDVLIERLRAQRLTTSATGPWCAMPGASERGSHSAYIPGMLVP